MILSGEKTEEYRELKRYYDSRFRNAAMLKNQEYQASVSEFRNLAATVDQDIGTVKFRNGYAPDAPYFLADNVLTSSFRMLRISRNSGRRLAKAICLMPCASSANTLPWLWDGLCL